MIINKEAIKKIGTFKDSDLVVKFIEKNGKLDLSKTDKKEKEKPIEKKDDTTDTNKILLELIEKVNKPVSVNLTLE